MNDIADGRSLALAVDVHVEPITLRNTHQPNCQMTIGDQQGLIGIDVVPVLRGRDGIQLRLQARHLDVLALHIRALTRLLQLEPLALELQLTNGAVAVLHGIISKMLAINATKDCNGGYDGQADHEQDDFSPRGHKEAVRVSTHPDLALTVCRTPIAYSHLQHRRVLSARAQPRRGLPADNRAGKGYTKGGQALRRQCHRTARANTDHLVKIGFRSGRRNILQSPPTTGSIPFQSPSSASN